MKTLQKALTSALLHVTLTGILVLAVALFVATGPFLATLKGLMYVGDLVHDRIKLDARPKA